MRDRLYEMIVDAENELYIEKPYITDDERIKNTVDKLLAAGVIVPPCKVGQLVYVIRSQTGDSKNLYIFEDRITHYRIFGDYVSMCFENHIALLSWNWSNVFLTREEAENALAERSEA